MVFVESKGLTDVGRTRKNNEDNLILDDALGLYMVADGLGGHNAGDVASRLVVETIHDYMIKSKYAGHKDNSGVPYETLSEEANRLLFGIQSANKRIYETSHNEETCHGMGSTVSAVYFAGETFIAANVGDSPIYLIHEDSIDLLSVPHTVKAEMEALDPKSAKGMKREFGHMLTRAVGIQKNVEVDICEIQYFKNDTIVISSDGLSNMVSPEEILDVVKKQRPHESCSTLVDLANKHGGDDNVTVIVLEIKTVRRRKGMVKKLISWVLPLKQGNKNA